MDLPTASHKHYSRILAFRQLTSAGASAAAYTGRAHFGHPTTVGCGVEANAGQQEQARQWKQEFRSRALPLPWPVGWPCLAGTGRAACSTISDRKNIRENRDVALR